MRKILVPSAAVFLALWGLLVALSWCHATPKSATYCAISLCTTVESKMLFPFGYERQETVSIVPGMEFMAQAFPDMLETRVVEEDRFFFRRVSRFHAVKG